jgi:hypothetical protein
MLNSKLTASNSALEADLDGIDAPDEEDGPGDMEPPLADARNAAATAAVSAAAADPDPAAGFGASFEEPPDANGVAAPGGGR